MISEPKTTSETERETQEEPIVTYLNGLLKQMGIINGLLSDRNNSLSYLPQPIRVLIANLPPNGQAALKEHYDRLCQFEQNVNIIQDHVDIEKIYQDVHNWCYNNLFQDAFRAHPKAKKPGNL